MKQTIKNLNESNSWMQFENYHILLLLNKCWSHVTVWPPESEPLEIPRYNWQPTHLLNTPRQQACYISTILAMNGVVEEKWSIWTRHFLWVSCQLLKVSWPEGWQVVEKVRSLHPLVVGGEQAVAVGVIEVVERMELALKCHWTSPYSHWNERQRSNDL